LPRSPRGDRNSPGPKSSRPPPPGSITAIIGGSIRAVSDTNPLGAPQRLATHLSSLDGSGFAGSFSDGRSTLSFDYTTIAEGLPVEAAAAPGGHGRVAAGAGFIVVIVLSAAVIMAGGCAAHALLTDCVGDCAEGCWLCTHCAMDHATEGLCGTCECYCLCEEGRPRQLFNEGGECP
jgi:hypothetical protein